MTTKKKTAKTQAIKDYLRLPFEVHYSSLSYTSLELLSEEHKIKKPKQFKGIHLEQGNAYGVTFYCEKNSGAELICCLTESHGEACPDWLSMIEEEDMNMNHGEDFGVEVDGEGLNLHATAPDDIDSFEPTGYSTGIYRLEGETFDFIVLDADGDRIKIDEHGDLINENEDDDDNDDSQAIIDLESLREDESLTDFSTCSNSEAQDRWIKKVWEEAFPKLQVPTITEYAL
jgi:hypothetical protein